MVKGKVEKDENFSAPSTNKHKSGIDYKHPRNSNILSTPVYLNSLEVKTHKGKEAKFILHLGELSLQIMLLLINQIVQN